ncbi:MAG: 50S ribosomal protein L25 [Candidatus Gracilibacteria bacterium]|nr:50S ribosomal protein L25 [Candidatus Gracilibacteria bacterium]
MEEIAFTAEPRAEGIKPNVLRQEGKVPGVLYGHGVEPVSLQFSLVEFDKVFRQAGENTIIDLKIGDKKEKVLVYDLQRDPIKDHVTHVDFYRVNLKEKITTTVPIEFIGVSPAVKEEGAVFVANREEVEVKCLPTDIPKKFEVDISGLKIFGDSLHVSDLIIPEGVELIDEAQVTIAQVAAPKMQAEAEAAKEEAVAAAEAAKETPVLVGAEEVAPVEGEVAAPAKEEAKKG